MSAVDSMVNTIPVIVTGAVVMKFADQMGNMSAKTKRRSAKGKRKIRKTGSGMDFSNVGF
jgi:hypothetical protein